MRSVGVICPTTRCSPSPHPNPQTPPATPPAASQSAGVICQTGREKPVLRPNPQTPPTKPPAASKARFASQSADATNQTTRSVLHSSHRLPIGTETARFAPQSADATNEAGHSVPDHSSHLLQRAKTAAFADASTAHICETRRARFAPQSADATNEAGHSVPDHSSHLLQRAKTAAFADASTAHICETRRSVPHSRHRLPKRTAIPGFASHPADPTDETGRIHPILCPNLQTPSTAPPAASHIGVHETVSYLQEFSKRTTVANRGCGQRRTAASPTLHPITTAPPAASHIGVHETVSYLQEFSKRTTVANRGCGQRRTAASPTLHPITLLRASAYPGAKLRNNHCTPVLYDACHPTARENPRHVTLRHSSPYRSAESDSKRSELECSSDLWWRSQRDSNPRAANATNTLAGCPFRPLRHDSTLHFKSATACKHSSPPRPTQIPLLLRVTVRAPQRGCAPISADGSNPGHTRRPKSQRPSAYPPESAIIGVPNRKIGLRNGTETALSASQIVGHVYGTGRYAPHRRAGLQNGTETALSASQVVGRIGETGRCVPKRRTRQPNGTEIGGFAGGSADVGYRTGQRIPNRSPTYHTATRPTPAATHRTTPHPPTHRSHAPRTPACNYTPPIRTNVPYDVQCCI